MTDTTSIANFDGWLNNAESYEPSMHERFINAYIKWSREVTAKEIKAMREACVPFVAKEDK